MRRARLEELPGGHTADLSGAPHGSRLHAAGAVALAAGVALVVLAGLSLDFLPGRVIAARRAAGEAVDASAVEAEWIGRFLAAGSAGSILVLAGLILRITAPRSNP